MGKGDKKTRRGKLFSGSYGVLRPRKRSRSFSVVSSTKKAAAKVEQPKAANQATPTVKEALGKDAETHYIQPVLEVSLDEQVVEAALRVHPMAWWDGEHLKKTVATGSVVPRKEIAIKPQVSGIVDELFVEPGDKVRVLPSARDSRRGP